MAPDLFLTSSSLMGAIRTWPPGGHLVQLIRAFAVGHDTYHHGRRLAEAVVRQIDTARWSSITIADQQTLITTAAGAVHSADLACDRRWPVFGVRAADHGAAAMLSYRISTQPRQVMALNVYADHRYAFTEQDDHYAGLLARHLALAVDPTAADPTASDPIGGQTDLLSGPGIDDVVGQAKQVLRARVDLTDRQAFYLLVDYAHRTGRKLFDIAEHLTAPADGPDKRPGGDRNSAADPRSRVDAVPARQDHIGVIGRGMTPARRASGARLPQQRLSYGAAMATSNGAPMTAATSIDGQPWQARVRQFRDRAYIEVWGDGGFDADTQIATTDVLTTAPDPGRQEPAGAG